MRKPRLAIPPRTHTTVRDWAFTFPNILPALAGPDQMRVRGKRPVLASVRWQVGRSPLQFRLRKHRAPEMHPDCTPIAPKMHPDAPAQRPHAPCLHPVCTLGTTGAHPICTQYATDDTENRDAALALGIKSPVVEHKGIVEQAGSFSGVTRVLSVALTVGQNAQRV
jgi:hypothetical protein